MVIVGKTWQQEGIYDGRDRNQRKNRPANDNSREAFDDVFLPAKFYFLKLKLESMGDMSYLNHRVCDKLVENEL